MPNTVTCERCGSPLELFSSGGVLCARCLARSLAPEPPDDPEPLSPARTLPRQFGAYELLEEIGRGGMGVVYRARQLALDRPVAVKLLLAGAYSSEAALWRFQLEAATAASLQHPAIVPIHDYGECDGQPFYAMDLIAGRDLAAVCDGRPLEARRAARLVATLARAVQHAHEGGIAHRDLKPSNILIDADDRPHITDFGLAIRLDRAEGVTITGQMVGSPSYVAPEQALGSHDDVGVAGDVYGLGALLYHLVTGRPPFNAATPTETLRLVLDTDPPPPRLLNPGLPRDLETISLMCLAKEPARRYASAGAVADDCVRFLEQRPIHARRPSVFYRLRKLVLRRRLACGAVTMIVVLAGIGLSVFVRASSAEAMAQQRRAQIEEIFTRALHVADPGYSHGRQATLKELLDETARWVPGEFADDPRLAADIHARIGETYCKLMFFESAVPHLETAWATRQRLLSEEHPDYWTSLRDLGILRLWQQRYAEAEEYLGRVLAIQERTLGRDAEEALRTRDEIVFGREMRLTLNQTIAEADRPRFLAEHGQLARASHDLAKRRWGDEHPVTLLQEQNLARTMLRGEPQDIEAAERMFAHNVQTNARVLGPEHPNTIIGMSDWGQALLRLGRNDEALKLLQKCVPLAERVLGPEHGTTAWAMQQLESALRAAGRVDEANALVPRYVLAWMRVYGPANASNITFAVRRMNYLAWALGRPDAVADFALERLAEFRDRDHLAPDSLAIGAMLLLLADARLAQQRIGECEQHLCEATAILGPNKSAPAILWNVHRMLGEHYRSQKKFPEAEAEFLIAHRGLQEWGELQAPARQLFRSIFEALVRLYTEWDHAPRAVEWRERLEAFDRVETERTK